MGIYSDIQADIKEAMGDDLADAVATLVITETASSTSYNAVSGDITNTPVISTMRCIVVDAELDDENEVYSETTNQSLEVMILDSERTCTFNAGLMASVRGIDYEVMKHRVDPAGATHSLELRGI